MKEKNVVNNQVYKSQVNGFQEITKWLIIQHWIIVITHRCCFLLNFSSISRQFYYFKTNANWSQFIDIVIKMGFVVSSRIGQYLSSESDHSKTDKLAGKTTITNDMLDYHWLKGWLGEIRTIRRQLNRRIFLYISVLWVEATQFSRLLKEAKYMVSSWCNIYNSIERWFTSFIPTLYM